MRKSFYLLAAVALVTATAASHGAIVYIPNTQTTDVSNASGVTNDTSFNATLSGFSSPITSGVTTDTQALTDLNTSFGRFSGSMTNLPQASVTYNFSTPLNGVSGFLLWNYWETSQGTNDGVRNRGIQGATLTITYSGGTAVETFNNFLETPSNNSGAPAQQLSFSTNYNGVTAIGFNNITDWGNTSFAGWDGFAVTVVPEPSAFAALIGGTGVLMGLRRRRTMA
jgi:hypothetical protein